MRGRTWTDKSGVEKIFNTIDGWNIVLTSNHVTQGPTAIQSFQQREQATLTQKDAAAPVQIGDDGLPF
jgi:hypothetical protein